MAVAVFQQRKRIQFLWFVAPLAVLLTLFSRSAWAQDSLVSDLIRLVGLVLILTCIAGRCWASLYVGRRKNQELVTAGPYAHTRNPLYLFSTIGLAGVGLTLGSVLLALLLACLSYAVFTYVIAKEEATLERFFGSEYRHYRESVPQFFPRLSGSNASTDSSVVEFYPTALKRTAIDASYFLLAVPAAELVDWLQQAEIIRPIIALY